MPHIRDKYVDTGRTYRRQPEIMSLPPTDKTRKLIQELREKLVKPVSFDFSYLEVRIQRVLSNDRSEND